MKYMLITFSALLVSFLAGGLLTHFLKKKFQMLRFRFSSVLGTLTLGIVILCAITFSYLSIYYHAGPEAIDALSGDSQRLAYILTDAEATGNDTALSSGAQQLADTPTDAEATGNDTASSSDAQQLADTPTDAEATGNSAASSDDTQVQVSKIQHGYFFDGPGEDSALIFYPGAKVEATAYVPLMLQLAKNGKDCFLTEMPFNMAFFGSRYGEDFLADYDYEHWSICGHSMGGMIAAGFANSHTDSIESLILLAAYPTSKIDDSLQFLSIYGDMDGCLNRSEYEKNKSNWPENQTEYIISGGNHAQYAVYGPQKGDGKATISWQEQVEITVEQILNCIS